MKGKRVNFYSDDKSIIYSGVIMDALMVYQFGHPNSFAVSGYLILDDKSKLHAVKASDLIEIISE